MYQSVLMVFKYLFAFTLCVTNASSVSFIKKCKVDDTKCIVKSTQEAIPIFAAGIPDLGVSVLDPIYLKKIDGSSANTKLILTDVYLKGLKGCTAKKVELQNINSPSKKLIIKVVCSVEINSKYEMKGQLVVPIEGKGKASVVINDTTFNVDCVLNDKIAKDEKKYLNVKSCTHTHEFKPNAKVHFDNLFPDNEVLAQAARDVIETNPDAVVAELGPAVIKSIMDVLIKNIGNFAAHVPYEDLVILD